MDYKYLKENEPIIIKGHDNADVDALCSCYVLQKLLDFKGIKSNILISDGIIDPLYDFEKYKFNYITEINSDNKLFLVDHYYKADNVIACIDHHPSDIVNSENFIYKPQSSCAKIILDEMIKENMPLSEDIVYLTVYSLYMDTLSFKSKKATLEDKDWAEKQILKYGFDKDALYEAGLVLNDISVINKEAVTYGFKEYNINNNTVGTSYLILKTKPEQEVINNILQELQNNNSYDYWMHFINCVEEDKTYVYLLHNGEYIEQAFEGNLSRGKNLIPMLHEKLPMNDDLDR